MSNQTSNNTLINDAHFLNPRRYFLVQQINVIKLVAMVLIIAILYLCAIQLSINYLFVDAALGTPEWWFDHESGSFRYFAWISTLSLFHYTIAGAPIALGIAWFAPKKWLAISFSSCVVLVLIIAIYSLPRFIQIHQDDQLLYILASLTTQLFLLPSLTAIASKILPDAPFKAN